MSTYRVEWPCGDVTETDSWEPNECPICEAEKLRTETARWLQAAEQGERAAVVAWLRGRAVAARDHATNCRSDHNEAKAWAEADECVACANAIERGEHRAGEVKR